MFYGTENVRLKNYNFVIVFCLSIHEVKKKIFKCQRETFEFDLFKKSCEFRATLKC